MDRLKFPGAGSYGEGHNHRTICQYGNRAGSQIPGNQFSNVGEKQSFTTYVPAFCAIELAQSESVSGKPDGRIVLGNSILETVLPSLTKILRING